MPGFEYRAPPDIRFGRGKARTAVADIVGLGQGVLLCHGRDAARSDWLADDLAARGARVLRVVCAEEPTLEMLELALPEARAHAPDVVVALGGGAAVDFGKALAALIPAASAPLDHLEVVGRGLPLAQDPLSFVAIPTTAGTGSEVTKNAVIGVPEAHRKVSLRDARMIANIAIVDPELTDNTPREITLASGLDAVTQVIEPFLCSRANAMTDALCLSAIPSGLSALSRLMHEDDPEARDALAYVSLCGGLALSNAGLGAVHGFAGVIGGRTSASHGAICGTLLPHVLTANKSALGLRGEVADRFVWVADQIARTLGGTSEDAFDNLAAWSRNNGLPGIVELGLKADDFSVVAEEARISSSMKANPVELDADALAEILRQAA